MCGYDFQTEDAMMRHCPAGFVMLVTLLAVARMDAAVRTEDGVDPGRGRPKPACQHRELADSDTCLLGDADRVLSGGDGLPHPVPAVLDHPPAR